MSKKQHHAIEHCRICEKPIEMGELCEKCAEGNDPFVTCTNAARDLKRP